MALPTISPNQLNTVVSTTLQNYLPNLVVQVLQSTPLLKMIFEGSDLRTQGGVAINARLLYGFNSTTGVMGKGDIFDASPQEAITAAQYKWANTFTSVGIFGEDEYANSGEPMLTNFVAGLVTQAELSKKRLMNELLFGDGTGSNGNAPDGLLNLIFPSAVVADPAGGPVGNVSAVAYPFWMPSAITNPGSYAANGPYGTGTANYQLRMFNTVTDGMEQATVIVQDQQVFESYQNNADNRFRIVDTGSLDGGYTTVMYKGVPMLWDRNCPAGTQFFINTKYLNAVIDSNRFFQPTDWIPIFNQDYRVMRIHTRYNIVATNRMLQGVIQGWTA